jgi:hypothetical protein
MQLIGQKSIAYEDLKHRLLGIESNLEKFCETIGIAAITAKKWKNAGVPYRYVLLLEYFEMLFSIDQKYNFYTDKIKKSVKKSKAAMAS